MTCTGFNVVGTTAIAMNFDVNSDPTTWTYTYTHVPNTDETFNWFSAISYASTDPRDDEVYILGTRQHNINTLSRAKLSDLLAFNFEGIEFWDGPRTSGGMRRIWNGYRDGTMSAL